jgi:toxin ParE1/3/4
LTIEWSDEARLALERLRTRLQRISPVAADRIVRRVTERVEQLRHFPYIGRMMPENDLPPLRELLVGDYRVVYLVRSQSILIVTVFHAAMDLRDQ